MSPSRSSELAVAVVRPIQCPSESCIAPSPSEAKSASGSRALSERKSISPKGRAKKVGLAGYPETEIARIVCLLSGRLAQAASDEEADAIVCESLTGDLLVDPVVVARLAVLDELKLRRRAARGRRPQK